MSPRYRYQSKRDPDGKVWDETGLSDNRGLDRYAGIGQRSRLETLPERPLASIKVSPDAAGSQS